MGWDVWGKPLTFGADDLGPVPFAIAPAPDDGHMVLGKSFITLVAYCGMDIILGLAGANGRGVLHCWRGTAQHWGQRDFPLEKRTGLAPNWFQLLLRWTLNRYPLHPAVTLKG